MAIKLAKLVSFLGERYPYALAEKWDNVGLIFGDPAAQVERALVALDISHDVIDEAIERGANAIITHHPPIFQGIKRIDGSTTQGSIIMRCLENKLASIALHTNLDSATGGLNDAVFDLLRIGARKPLIDAGNQRFYKLIVFTPKDAAEKVRQACFDAGAGQIGDYDHASFNTEGTGTFRPLEGANPAIGEVGAEEHVEEVRSEFFFPRERFGQIYSAMLRAHPYEEVAYDLIPLANRDKTVGLGRVGKLPEAVTLRQFCDQLSELGMMVTRFIGDENQQVQKLGICTGAGSDFSGRAADQGCDVYLSAEIKHHHALDADRRGLCIVETDHYTLERVIGPIVSAAINEHFGESMEALETNRERNTWTRYP